MATKLVSSGKAKFLGSTPGNSKLPINRTTTEGFGAASERGAGGKFLGHTKGNSTLPIDRTSGYESGRGSHKAGGKNAC